MMVVLYGFRWIGNEKGEVRVNNEAEAKGLNICCSRARDLQDRQT